MSSHLDPRKLGLPLAIVVLSYLADYAGYLSTWNQYISDARMALSQRPTQGDIVFVAVDARSVAEVGRWPWSRATHASLLQNLTEAGVTDVLFDFDFSFASDPRGDIAFVEALADAGGSVYLAVFEQPASAADPRVPHNNFPLPDFAQNSWPALVNVQTDETGFARFYPFGNTINGAFVPSAGSLMANVFDAQSPPF